MLSIQTLAVVFVKPTFYRQMDPVVEPEQGKKRKNADGSEILKWAVVAEYNLHRNGIDGMLEDGRRQEIMDRFGVSSSTITRYVKEWEQERNVAIVPDLSPDRTGKCGVGNLKLTEYLVDCILNTMRASLRTLMKNIKLSRRSRQ